MLFPHTLEAKKMKTPMHTIVGENCWCELFDLKNPNTKFVSQQRVEKASHKNTILNKLEIQKMLHTMQNWTSICKYNQKNMLQYLLQLQHNVYKEEQGRKYMDKDK
jgi:hypothetical protein